MSTSLVPSTIAEAIAARVAKLPNGRLFHDISEHDARGALTAAQEAERDAMVAVVAERSPEVRVALLKAGNDGGARARLAVVALREGFAGGYIARRARR